MKFLAGFLAATAMLLAAGAAAAQTAAGDWTGLLTANPAVTFRLAVHIQKSGDGYSGTLDDQSRGAYAIALTDESSPAYLPGLFQTALGSVLDSPRITEAAKTGEGFGWHEHGRDVFDGCERFFRPGYNANLTTGWLPALDGVEEKLHCW